MALVAPVDLRKHGLGAGVVIVFALGHLLQIATPLRLNVDSITYMLMAISGAEGQGFLVRGNPAQFPPGYPAFLATLDTLGMSSPAWIVLANVLALGVGCLAAFVATKRSGLLSPRAALWVVAATLASFATIKHVTLPMAESVFFMLTMLFAWAVIATTKQAELTRRLAFTAMALLLGVAAWMTRSVGIVLLIPLLGLIASGGDLGGRTSELVRKHMLQAGLLALLVMGAVAVAWWWILGTEYYADSHRHVHSWGLGTYLRIGLSHSLVELGEIGLNVPMSQFARIPQATAINYLAGGSVLVLALMGLMTRSRSIGPLDILFATYLVSMLVWISVDARFWIPVLPLVFAYAWLGLKWLVPRTAPTLCAAYLVCFFLIGLGALGFSTRLSLMSPQEFAHQYGDRSFIPAYQAAAGNGAREDLDGMNRRAYDVLLRFGRSDQLSISHSADQIRRITTPTPDARSD